MNRPALTLKVFLAVIVNDLIDGLAQMMMKMGLVQPAVFSFSIHDTLIFILQNAASPLVWAGICLYALNFFIWIAILSRIDLSLAVPLGSATYLVIPLLAMFFLHENMPPLRWAGIFLIMAGIYLLSQSKPSPAPLSAL